MDFTPFNEKKLHEEKLRVLLKSNGSFILFGQLL
jgi:hypothetical protein